MSRRDHCSCACHKEGCWPNKEQASDRAGRSAFTAITLIATDANQAITNLKIHALSGSGAPVSETLPS